MYSEMLGRYQPSLQTMDKSFDPYLKWLGIPPKDQPAHHYRLLGIETFESDPEVISNAADQRMAHLKNFAAGKRSAVSQQILNEIAAARVCLLNDSQREQYDVALRKKMQPQPPQAQKPPRQPPPVKSAAAIPVVKTQGPVIDVGRSASPG